MGSQARLQPCVHMQAIEDCHRVQAIPQWARPPGYRPAMVMLAQALFLAVSWPVAHALSGLQVAPAAGQAANASTEAAAAASGSTQQEQPRKWSRGVLAVAGVGAAAAGLTFAMADEAEHGLAAPSYPWSHHGWLSAFDHASIRR